MELTAVIVRSLGVQVPAPERRLGAVGAELPGVHVVGELRLELCQHGGAGPRIRMG